MNREIVDRLTNLRKQNGLSPEELAAKLGLTHKIVSDWEQGASSPDVDNLISLSELYHISFNDLLKTKNGLNQGDNMVNFAHMPAEKQKKRVSLRGFPFGMIITFIYLILGLFFHMWGTAWVIFLTFPIFAGIGEYLHHRQ